jgi:hypothetical protein
MELGCVVIMLIVCIFYLIIILLIIYKASFFYYGNWEYGEKKGRGRGKYFRKEINVSNADQVKNADVYEGEYFDASKDGFGIIYNSSGFIFIFIYFFFFFLHFYLLSLLYQVTGYIKASLKIMKEKKLLL